MTKLEDISAKYLEDGNELIVCMYIVRMTRTYTNITDNWITRSARIGELTGLWLEHVYGRLNKDDAEVLKAL